MEPTSPVHEHAPRISVETLQFLAMVLLIVLDHGILLQAGSSVIDHLRIYRNWRARPVIPPPKLLLFKDLQTHHKEIAFPSTWTPQESLRVPPSDVSETSRSPSPT
jgi:hypothetical protein